MKTEEIKNKLINLILKLKTLDQQNQADPMKYFEDEFFMELRQVSTELHVLGNKLIKSGKAQLLNQLLKS